MTVLLKAFLLLLLQLPEPAHLIGEVLVGIKNMLLVLLSGMGVGSVGGEGG